MYLRSKPRPHYPRYSRFSGRSGVASGPRGVKAFNPSELVMRSQGAADSVPSDVVVSHAFGDFPLIEKLKQNITARGYLKPTPIQDQVIDQVLLGRDVIGTANTGTGKTAAFIIPLLNKVFRNRSERVLVVAPTRELAGQIRDELLAFASGLNIYGVLCIGGANIQRQRNELHRPFNFVIGTPGRLKDLAEEGHLRLGGFTTVVLDEADHMVDIGFIHDIKYLISRLPAVRQSLFFSATVGEKVQEILAQFVKEPVVISVKTRETAENVAQTIIPVTDRQQKIEQLHDLLIQKGCEKVLVFGRTKWGVQKLADELVKRGFKADAIHGNKKQSQRQRTLDRFKNNELQILLATDVASRGLDIPNVSHVINYDLPESHDTYIHRIGRTGRADKKGVALTFVEPPYLRG